MPFVVIFLFTFVILTSLSRHIKSFGSERGICMKRRQRVRIWGGNVAEERRGRLSGITVWQTHNNSSIRSFEVFCADWMDADSWEKPPHPRLTVAFCFLSVTLGASAGIFTLTSDDTRLTQLTICAMMIRLKIGTLPRKYVLVARVMWVGAGLRHYTLTNVSQQKASMTESHLVCMIQCLKSRDSLTRMGF